MPHFYIIFFQDHDLNTGSAFSSTNSTQQVAAVPNTNLMVESNNEQTPTITNSTKSTTSTTQEKSTRELFLNSNETAVTV